MSSTVPILLSFYALSNGKQNMLFGQLTHSSSTDLSFTSYSTERTFQTLFFLYQTKLVSNQNIELIFGDKKIPARTDISGAFFTVCEALPPEASLTNVQLADGRYVRIMEHLISGRIHTVDAHTIVVSDIDDTILHSHISNKIQKFTTLMFTAMEKRKVVKPTMVLIRELYEGGATPFYLSNSEQNLYPLIYRFLTHNNFPKGPLFLKRLLRLRNFIWKIKFKKDDLHKLSTLEKIIPFFNDKQFILIGDNTQHDLEIYLKMAEAFPAHIKYIVIREVKDKPASKAMAAKASPALAAKGVGLYYGQSFPNGRDVLNVQVPSEDPEKV